MPNSNWSTQGDIRSETQGRSKTNGSHTDEWTLKDVGVEWQHTREYTHACTKGHPKPSERQVNMVCSWTVTFSCWGRLDQPSRWPLGQHARRPWLADGAELLNHSVSWFVFRDAGRSARWVTFEWNEGAEMQPRLTEIQFMGVFIHLTATLLGTACQCCESSREIFTTLGLE